MWTLKGSTFVCIILSLCGNPVFSHHGEKHKEDKLSVLYEWGFMEYVYDSPQQKQEFLQNGNLIPNKPALIDVDVYHNRENGERTVFITTPRFNLGVPASLGTVVIGKDKKPALKPYPSWDWYKDPRKCRPNRIVSVYRIAIDECDRLWILDNGELEAGVICPPQVLAFDLKTNRLIKKFEIPKDQYIATSNFVNPIVEILSKENECKKTFLYLADASGYAIVVYDLENNNSWKVQHYTMYPDPDFAVYTIKGESFVVMDGVLGMALSPKLPKEERKLFYHAMSSDTEHWVYTKNLQNKTASGNSKIFNTYKGRRGTQTVAEAIDKEGVMFFGLVSEIDIACFNIEGNYGRNCSSTDIVAYNEETLQFASGVKVISNPSGKEELWVVTDRYPKIDNNDIKDTEINFRVLVGDVKDLKKGTRCERQPDSGVTYEGSPHTFPPNNKKKK